MALGNLLYNTPGINIVSSTTGDPNFKFKVKAKAEAWFNTWGKPYGYSINLSSSLPQTLPARIQIPSDQVKILSDRINAESASLISEAVALYSDITRYSGAKSQFQINSLIASGDTRFRSKTNKTMLALMVENQVMIQAFGQIQTALSGRTTYRF